MPSLDLLGPAPHLSSAALFGQSSLFGFGIAFSPLHIAVVVLLLLGTFPLRRALAFVSGWASANGLAVVVLMVVGDNLSLAVNHGERGQVMIDLAGAAVLMALGVYQLTPAAAIGEQGMAMRLMRQLPDFSTPMLVLIGAASALVTPENLVFYLKEAGLLLINQPGTSTDLELTGVFVAVASSLLLLPPLAWIATGGRIRDPLSRLEDWMEHHGEWLVGVLALLISAYLIWEGLHGLWLLQGAAPL
ncbi:GAP family protein [Synechococcus sp. CBW1107]|nr:GAP family protein [Synechococcus sp. CBW1107]